MSLAEDTRRRLLLVAIVGGVWVLFASYLV